MTTERQPTGPDPEAITTAILERWPETDVVHALGASFFSVDPETHWPNFATIVTTDEHDEGAPSRLDERPGAFRLNIGVSRDTFERIAAEAGEAPDYAAVDVVFPHPVYAKQRWVSIINPTTATFDQAVMPLLEEAHDRLAAVRNRHASGPSDRSSDTEPADG
jgi:hypothetical protein